MTTLEKAAKAVWDFHRKSAFYGSIEEWEKLTVHRRALLAEQMAVALRYLAENPSEEAMVAFDMADYEDQNGEDMIAAYLMAIVEEE